MPQSIGDLTEQQQAIVAHNHGPALVFAVAGAGKTTAMTHRIERLVREAVFPAHSILATSFSKASVRDIKTALEHWPHCAGVAVQTLHAVGWGILKMAQQRGYGRELNLSRDEESGGESLLLGRVVGQAWRGKAAYAEELDGLDRADFLNYVGVMKANLLYADLEKADLPPAALAAAGTASMPPGFAWYRDLYGLYERVRVEENVLTFDDMLLSAWETLHRFPEVLDLARQRFACIIVDEFQDVNRVQSEILDLLTFPHRHYMAIGDDDQTIYEWRGADPGFILNFAARYGAVRYFIHDNFRSHAAPLALANRVIAHNQKREPKALSLTRGFGGTLTVHDAPSPEAQGRHLAQLILEAQAVGHPLRDMAILLRLYAQTPPLEQGLLEAGVPYQIVGSSPFYARPEVVTLLDYVRLARGDQGWEGRWMRLANKPARYLSRTFCEGITRSAGQGTVLPRALADAAREAPAHQASRLRDLAETLHWLAGTFNTLPAGAALTLLDQRLGYADYLRRSSGFPETGQARAATVEAFLRYAHGFRTVTDLLTQLEVLAESRAGQTQRSPEGITLLTVFRAKGLQWPVVFVPDCNQGIFPYGGPSELEEERRLFYVALTRTQSDLHLQIVRTEPPSQFLVEADWKNTLAAVDSIGSLWAHRPAQWSTGEVLTLARQTPALGLSRYFAAWHEAEQALAAARRVQNLLAAAQERGLQSRLGLDRSHGDAWQEFSLSPGDVPDHFADLADFVTIQTEPLPSAAFNPAAFNPQALQIGGSVTHSQHGLGRILAIRGDRLSPRLEIQFARGKPIVLPAKFIEQVH